MNRIVMIGRLTKDIELRTTTTDKKVADFTLAVNKRVKPTDGSPDAEFYRCNAWGQQAEFLANYAGKGRLVAVDGRLQTRKYTTNDGQNREVVEIVAENVSLLDRPQDSNPRAGGGTEDRGTLSAVPANEEYDVFADN